jgi:haloalkane dehalogenase
MCKFSYPTNLYPFQSEWISINGNSIHYIDEGKGDIILFFHPPVTSSFMYRSMIKDLSTGFRCIALDFPGFGLSEISSPAYVPSINSQAEVVDGFLKALQLPGPVYFLMQECGGHAAIKVFMKFPEKLKGIILTDTIIYPVSAYPRIKIVLSIINGRIFNFINSNYNFLIRAMTKFGIRNKKLSIEERNTYKALFNTKTIRRTSTRLLHLLVTEENLMLQIQKSFETVFNKLPTLIIYGEKDPLTAMGVPQRISDLLPNSELHFIKNEGHFPHEGDAGKMSELITAWITRVR